MHYETAENGLIIREFLTNRNLHMVQNFYKSLLYENIENIIDYNAKIADGEINREKETFCNGRLSLSNQDIMARSIFYEVGKLIEKHYKIELDYSFVYPGVYLPGSSLPIHTDKQCGEYVASLTIYNENFNYWPFYINDEEIVLREGDLVVYNGQVPHYRNTIPNQGFNISIFMLFVDKNGPNADSVKEITHRLPPVYEYNLSDLIVKE